MRQLRQLANAYLTGLTAEDTETSITYTIYITRIDDKDSNRETSITHDAVTELTRTINDPNIVTALKKLYENSSDYFNEMVKKQNEGKPAATITTTANEPVIVLVPKTKSGYAKGNVMIYDRYGRIVRRISRINTSAFTWNKKDDKAQNIKSGIYYIVISSSSEKYKTVTIVNKQ